jgi:ribonucleoside-diphosphate reductase alpha chain/ribonucleoside-triphosphate reductase
MQVIKRNNTIVDFDKQKIVLAIEKSMMETEQGIDEELSSDIADNIEEDIKELDIVPTVETIQDMVEEYLMDSDRKDCAKRYILYREERNRLRNIKANSKYKFITEEFVSKYKHIKPPFTNLGHFVYLRTYSRWLSEEGRREYWWETVRRAVEYNCSLIPDVTQQEAEKLYDNIFNLKQFLSGRTLYTGGTEASKKYPMSNYNCSFTVADDFEAFKDLFYLLLIGAGVGLRVRKEDINQLPSVRGDLKIIHKAYTPVHKKDRKEYTAIDFEDNMIEIFVGDSKEAWCQALDYFLKLFYLNEFSKVNTIIMNYDNVRQTGERLKTFGGYASGYKPFMEMIDKLYKILVKDNTYKKKLKPIDCLDIANIIGVSVVSGGVRRTSEVILFDYDDEETYQAKTNLYKEVEGEWTLDKDLSHRRMSNNSIQYTKKPSRVQWHKNIQEMRISGEPAFQNLEAAKKRKEDAEGGNPCMEIILRNRGMCNLTEVNTMGFVENGKLNYEELYKAQRLSARAGYRMACITFELYKWDKVNKEDMLIGCGLTGWQDMVNATNMKEDEEVILLERLKQITHDSANELADKLDKNRPKLYTTIKPSGTLSQLPTISSGIHFSHSPYYIRRVRINTHDPLVQVIKELEYPIYPEVGQTWENCDTVVIEFPVKSPIGKTKHDITAIEQLEIYKKFMKHYVDHNTSITVHVKNYEWDDVEQWVWDNWDEVVAISFLSLNDSFYQLMPYEEISEEEYNKRIISMKPFTPSLLTKYEKEEVEIDIGSSDCASGVCPVR